MPFDQVIPLTMSQDDQTYYRVYCWSHVTSFDWNKTTSETGKYLHNNLVEIRLSFEHYRCETFANFANNQLCCDTIIASSLSEPDPKLVFKSCNNIIEDESVPDIESLPTTPKTHLTTNDTDQTDRKKSRKKFKPSDLLRKLNCFKSFHSNSSTTTSLNCFGRTKLSPKANTTSNGNELSVENSTESQLKHKSISKSQIVHCHQIGNSLAGLPAKCLTEISDHHHTISKSIELTKSVLTNPVNENLVSWQTSADAPNSPDNTQQQNNLTCSQTIFHSFTQANSFEYKSDVDSVDTNSCELDIPNSIEEAYKPSQIDFRSIFDYNFTPNSTRGCIKADVYSLPSCIDNEITTKMLENKNSAFNSSKQRLPSYVSISRAISGYADYNKYCSEFKRDNKFLSNLISNVSSSHPCHAQILSSSVADQVDNYSSLPYEPTQPTVNKKSFLQKKIESLYGESFAEDWEKSRVKNRSPRSQRLMSDSNRSPSCPPNTSESSIFENRISLHKLRSLDSSDIDDLKPLQSTKLETILSDTNESQVESKVEIASESQDATWFLNEISIKSVQISVHIDKYNKLIDNCQDIPEDVVGKIRASIGKANLLLNKKFEQFHQLCQDSINQNENEKFKIKCDDLKGFWDMVLIQVEDVNQTFGELDRLKENNWLPFDETDLNKPNTPSRRMNTKFNCQRTQSHSISPKHSPKSDQTASPGGNDREIERKNRLIELKRKGKMKAKECSDDEIKIFTSNK